MPHNHLMELLKSAEQAIGNTPLVDLTQIACELNGRILAKLDYLNPGFSKKDRAAKQIIDDAEASGSLKPGQVVVELTSGNMGTGLAIVCAARGYPFVAVMSKGNSEERARMMRALGAEVVLVDQLPGSRKGEVSGADLALVEEEAKRITSDRKAFRADQFNHSGNFRSHYLHTGPELWHQSGGSITAFCDFVGSGGTFVGVSSFLRERSPDIGCYVVEPEGASAIAGKPVTCPDHVIQGGGYAIADLSFLESIAIDGFVEISGDEAKSMARRLSAEEGIFAGFSSGANVAAAVKLLQGPCKGGTVAVMICDSGLKYLSTDLWD